MKKVVRTLCAGLIGGLVLVQAPLIHATDAGPDKAMELVIEIPSPLGFEETLEKLEENAKALGWKVPEKWKIDFQKNLGKVTGRDIGPNRVLKMCAPEVAADLLVHDDMKKLATMMPCTIAVYQKSDGKTYISMMNLDLMGEVYGGKVAEVLQVLGPQMREMLQLQ